MKCLFRHAVCVLAAVLAILVFSPTVFADGCSHSTTSPVKTDSDGVWYHSLICNDCKEIIKSGLACYGGEDSCTMRAICSGCGKEYGAIPLGHIWESSIPDGQPAFNDDFHYDACATCGEARKSSIERHDFGIWRVTLSATEQHSGERTRFCETCGYSQLEIIPPIERNDNMGAIIFLIILGVLALSAGIFVLIWIFRYKRTMLDLIECIVAIATDLKNLFLAILGIIGRFFVIVFKSIGLFFVKVGVFFRKVGRSIRAFFQTVGIVIHRCIRWIKGFFGSIKAFFKRLG